MFKTIGNWFRRLADRWAPLPVPAPPAPLVPLDVLTSARHTVLEVDKTQHSSAFKASLALKALRVAYPAIRTRDLKLAIELAVREVLA